MYHSHMIRELLGRELTPAFIVVHGLKRGEDEQHVKPGVVNPEMGILAEVQGL